MLMCKNVLVSYPVLRTQPSAYVSVSEAIAYQTRFTARYRTFWAIVCIVDVLRYRNRPVFLHRYACVENR